MKNTKDQNTNAMEATIPVSDMDIYNKLQAAKTEIMNTQIHNSGVDQQDHFKCYELKDIVPTVSNVFNKLGLQFHVSFSSNVKTGEVIVTGTLVNTNNPVEIIVFTSPVKKSADAIEINAEGINKSKADDQPKGESIEDEINRIRVGLKQIRKNANAEDELFIADICGKVKAGLSKTEANGIISQITERLKQSK